MVGVVAEKPQKSGTTLGISRELFNQSHSRVLSSCLSSAPSLKVGHKIQSTNQKTSFFELKIARAGCLWRHSHQYGVPPNNSLMRASAEKTKQCFFFFYLASSNLIGLVSLVFKPSSTKRETGLRDMGKTKLVFNNFHSNLTKSLYKARKM